ncbi:MULTISPECIES: mechanosensitive ion channel family protein [unclassified Polaribacter]|jgi:small conductance mechanosensitive channel|uniref:mechanosensitive ion channel family protein n=1 Tax=unclassified Polaribacter TaxID=196858 RepID=UPI001C4E53F9|nr:MULTISPECIES: mechanosensitive ion channel family protein [unclassified Polaribacter]QXP68106.1 mechanosensitive ion channel family protein [Polaribacter sp. AHE13PA]QXP70284.1 mechanosensitive ion channel family protein [Polaribacter sp. R2A056_3_33]
MDTITQSLQNFYNTISAGLGNWGLQLIGAFAALIIGLWIIRMIMKGVSKGFEKTKLDETLQPFLLTSIGFILKLLLIISIAGIVGLPMASFAALMAGVGLAIGAAFNGSLGHIASGIMLLVFKPFKVGDLIKTNGAFGFVKEISVFVTVIETFQNETEIIPNSTITSNKITNLTKIGNLRIDMPFAIRYGSDIEKAKQIVLDVLLKDNHVLQEGASAPRVAVNNLGQNSVELLALPYANCENYWEVFWDTRQRIVEALGNAGYEAPLPQRVVTMTK